MDIGGVVGGDITPFAVLALVILGLLDLIKSLRKDNNKDKVDSAFMAHMTSETQINKAVMDAWDRNTNTNIKTVQALDEITNSLKMNTKEHDQIIKTLDRIEPKH